MGLGRCTPHCVQSSQGGTNTMGLKIDIFLTEASFIFLRLWVICLEFNSQTDNFCDFNPVWPLSGKCPPSPKYCAFLSDISWKWSVLLFSTLLYIYIFNLGSATFCCHRLCSVYMNWKRLIQLCSHVNVALSCCNGTFLCVHDVSFWDTMIRSSLCYMRIRSILVKYV